MYFEKDMPPKLVVIDDEEGVLEMILGHFGLRGFEVFAAGDGREGIELCRSEQPDVVLLDVKMQHLDGDRALPEIRSLLPAAKIFVISAYQDEIMKKRVLALGADACFEKPISILEIERSVRQALAI